MLRKRTVILPSRVKAPGGRGKGQREDMEEDTYTVDEAARILRVTQHRVRQMLREGGLAGERDEASGRWSIPQRAVHAMLEERREREALSEAAQNPDRKSTRLNSSH